jgi:ribonucleotide reductase alpha subunit
MQYDSQEARDYTEDLFERYAYFTMKASADLAKEK